MSLPHEMTDRQATAPLEITGLILAFLGIFPLAAVIKWAPVVAWLPRAGVEWALSTAAFALLCYGLARYAGDTVDRMLTNARNAVLASPARDFAIFAGLFTFMASIFVAWFVFGGQPTGGDEMAQRFQARLLVAGRLWGVAEQPYQFFSGIQTANVDGRWFAQFPIGGPLLLAIGTLLGAPWIVNPVLAGWTAASVYRFASKTTDETTARIATLLFAASPFVLLMSGSQMNHPGALAFLMYGMAALPDWVGAREARALRSAALRVGFGFAMSATIRPYEASVLGFVVGVFQIVHARRSGAHLRSFAWQLAGGALPVAFLLYANAQQTGQAWLFGYDALNGASHRPGFHTDPTGVDFTPLQGIHHISSYLLLLNVSLFGAPIPSVVLVAGALLLARSATQWDYLNAALVVALLAAICLLLGRELLRGPAVPLHGSSVLRPLCRQAAAGARCKNAIAGAAPDRAPAAAARDPRRVDHAAEFHAISGRVERVRG
jgi:4-amino-4-deoxy-L-arabinose transferase-like glycosyltransferase